MDTLYYIICNFTYVLYRTRRRMIQGVVMAVVFKICSIFIFIFKIIHFKENGVTLYLGQAW